MRDIHWRRMTSFDLAAVEQIAVRVHPDYFEAPEIFAERLALYPEGTHVLEVSEKPAGYVLSHPWQLGSLPALNSLLDAIPASADTFYIHDLALLPLTRRIGAAGQIIHALVKHAQARGFANMSLVAVNGSQGFWQRHGFETVDRPELYGKLLSYEDGARFMMKPLV